MAALLHIDVLRQQMLSSVIFPDHCPSASSCVVAHRSERPSCATLDGRRHGNPCASGLSGADARFRVRVASAPRGITALAAGVATHVPNLLAR